jgi:hypothetical protein
VCGLIAHTQFCKIKDRLEAAFRFADGRYWPNVWSGRASQVDFAELAVSGLASMYPACD